MQVAVQTPCVIAGPASDVSSITTPPSVVADMTTEIESPARAVKPYTRAKLLGLCGAEQSCVVSESRSTTSGVMATTRQGCTTNSTGTSAGLPRAFSARTSGVAGYTTLGIHAAGEADGIEGEVQHRGRGAAAGADGEPLAAERESHAPGERALPRVRDGDAIRPGGRAPGSRGVPHLHGRHVERRDGRGCVGELVDLTGREEKQGQRARHGARSPLAAGEDPLQPAHVPKRAQVVARVASTRQV